MRTLVYKRTHRGDPNARGCFGIEDCMGRVRGYKFDSVIGVGGISREPHSQDIDGKINWIGLGARKTSIGNRKAPVVTFKHFCLFEEKGRNLSEIAPALAARLLSNNARVLVNFTPVEQEEVSKILKMAKDAPRSSPVHRVPDLHPRSKCGCRRKIR